MTNYTIIRKYCLNIDPLPFSIIFKKQQANFLANFHFVSFKPAVNIGLVLPSKINLSQPKDRRCQPPRYDAPDSGLLM